jgi:hypothetical protein
MKLNLMKEWCARMADLEDGEEIGAGRLAADPQFFDPAAPVRTRDGRAAVIEALDDPHMMGPYHYPIVASVQHPNDPGQWVRWHYMLNGRWKSNDQENGNDLVNKVAIITKEERK